ncbi:MAG: NADH:flavin oxidoreductase [Planctomycetaceae bacterium]|nr:NADH:flavin oxidoreductase [Planctomycetaceae bacterium]
MDATANPNSVIFEPLKFPSGLEVKNRVFRSNVSGRWDNYDGSGTYVRINWEEKFAKGGVGAIITSYTPVNIRGRILINYATIDNDDKIPFWRAVGERVHQYGCKLLMQLSHSGRQQDQGGVENEYKYAQSSTSTPDTFHGIVCRAMSKKEIEATVDDFADGARRARDAGLDGVELHGANGYLITQFLSSAINDRRDEYGGSLENRARFVREIVQAIRRKAGNDFHLQMKISAIEHGNALYPTERKGNRLADSVQICKWLCESQNGFRGVDAIHVSSGNTFPHPTNPPGGWPVEQAARWYDSMLSQGIYTRWVYFLLTNPIARPLFRWWWEHRRGPLIEGISLLEARQIKQHVPVPVICTGGFQDARLIRKALAGDGGLPGIDGVSIGRPLIANNNLVEYYAHGWDLPPRPCTFCNKCLVNDIENPLGCYEIDRYDGDYDLMMEHVMSVFYPSPFGPKQPPPPLPPLPTDIPIPPPPARF